MKKRVITAYDISMARRAGQTSLAVPDGALVTPQAADDARDYGISLVRGGQGPVSGAPAASPVQTGPQAGQDIAATVRRQVLARLGGAAPASLDAVIRSVMTGQAGADAGGGASCIRAVGTVTHVASAALQPRTGNAVPGAVAMTEAVPPGPASPGLGYMHWENSSFSWTFEQAAVLVVLEGEIVLTTGGASQAGLSGDSFLIPARSAVTLAAKGGARCVNCSWPNPETAKG